MARASRSKRFDCVVPARLNRSEELQSDYTVQALVPRFVDNPHAALSAGFQQFVVGCSERITPSIPHPPWLGLHPQTRYRAVQGSGIQPLESDCFLKWVLVINGDVRY